MEAFALILVQFLTCFLLMKPAILLENSPQISFLVIIVAFMFVNIFAAFMAFLLLIFENRKLFHLTWLLVSLFVLSPYGFFNHVSKYKSYHKKIKLKPLHNYNIIPRKNWSNL